MQIIGFAALEKFEFFSEIAYIFRFAVNDFRRRILSAHKFGYRFYGLICYYFLSVYKITIFVFPQRLGSS